jgi:hypothetical protein
MNIEGAVLENIARRAMDDGLELLNKGNLSDYEKGMLFAYFSMVDRTKLQAEISALPKVVIRLP